MGSSTIRSAGASSASSCASTAYLASRFCSRRIRSIARRRAVTISHAPGWSGTPVDRPLLERRDERVLRELLGQPDVPDQAGERGDEPR